MKPLPLVASVLCFFVQSAHANPIVNGDFSLGDSGFSSQYAPDTSAYSAGVYVVGADPQIFHSAAISFGDHTTGSGLMLLVNGATEPNKTVWQQDISVNAATAYIFSGWVTTWGQFCCAVDPSPPLLQFFVDDAQVGADYLVAPGNGQWNQFSIQFTTGNSNTASLRIVDLNVDPNGNDFAIDDLSVGAVAVPSPGAFPLMILGLGLLGIMTRRRGQN